MRGIKQSFLISVAIVLIINVLAIFLVLRSEKLAVDLMVFRQAYEMQEGSEADAMAGAGYVVTSTDPEDDELCYTVFTVGLDDFNQPGCIAVTNQFLVKLIFGPIIIYLIILISSFGWLYYRVHRIGRSIGQFKADMDQQFSSLTVSDHKYSFTELNLMNKIVKQSIETVNQTMSLREKYVTSIMHDLKTPLHIIRGSIDIIELSGADSEYAEIIRNQIAAIDQTIATTSLERGYEINHQSCNPHTLVTSLIDVYKQFYPEHTFIITGDDEAIWELDQVAIHRIVQNLIDNGIKASEDQIVEVLITSDTIKVMNNGQDFTQADYERIITSENDHIGLRIVTELAQKQGLKVSYDKTEEYNIVAGIFK